MSSGVAAKAATILCSKCGQEGTPARTDRPCGVCRDCELAYQREWNRKNRARRSARVRENRRAKAQEYNAKMRAYRRDRNAREPGWQSRAWQRYRRRREEREAIAQGRRQFGPCASFAVARHEQTGRLAAFPVGQPLRPGFAVVARVCGAVVEWAGREAKTT